MIHLIVNHFKRLWAMKERMLIMFLMILCSIGFAIYSSNQKSQSMRIGVVNISVNELPQSDQLKFISLTKQPSIVQLIKGDYEAIVSKKGKTVEITSLKEEDFNQQLKKMMSGEQVEAIGKNTNNEGVGSKIIGFMLLFLLMTSVTNMILFNEDKEKMILGRIISTPISRRKLLVSYCLVNFMTIYLSSLLLVAAAKILGFNVGFSILTYSLLLALICLFATSFSLFNASLISSGDQANMFGSMIVLLTTLLAGSFFTIENKNRWIDTIIQWLPQKKYLTLVAAVENGTDVYQTIVSPLFYLSFITFLLFLISSLKVKIDNE